MSKETFHFKNSMNVQQSRMHANRVKIHFPVTAWLKLTCSFSSRQTIWHVVVSLHQVQTKTSVLNICLRNCMWILEVDAFVASLPYCLTCDWPDSVVNIDSVNSLNHSLFHKYSHRHDFHKNKSTLVPSNIEVVSTNNVSELEGG